MRDSALAENRKDARSNFAYPVEIKILSQHSDTHSSNTPSINGYLENVSISGLGILFEDRYGRVSTEGLNGSKVKITIVMPHGEKIVVVCIIRWVRKDAPEPFFIQLGIQFDNIEDWQLEAIKKLINIKNKDQNMMWNLWEQYEKHL